MSIFKQAFETTDIREFLSLIFPPEWKPIASRIIETGAEMQSGENVPWAARWSPIPLTIRPRNSDDELEIAVKSCIFRAHDCLHQLWGLPIPSEGFTSDDFYLFKRANMCGEVAVLMLTEFALCSRLYEMHKEVRAMLWERNALPMLYGPLKSRSWEQIAGRLDGILHKKLRPRWLREHKASAAFADDYVPMLQGDRDVSDIRWEIMTSIGWRPVNAPNSRYNADLDGLELTQWMIRDFFHLMETDEQIDEPLVDFNRERRRKIKFPSNWV